MSKKTTLQAELHTGTTGSRWTDIDWEGYGNAAAQWAGNIGKNGAGGDFFATNFCFNASDLSNLRAKTILSITLKLTVAKWNAAVNTNWPIGYKKNNNISGGDTSQAWRRTGANITAGLLQNPNGENPSPANPVILTADLGTTLPTTRGYTMGSYSSSIPSYTYLLVTGASLEVVTQETEYTVTFNANGGSGAPAAQTKDEGDSLTLSDVVPTRDGYTFAHWNTASDDSGTSYSPGGTYSADANATLYAIWTSAGTSGLHVKGSDSTMHDGSVYVKGSDNTMHQATVYVKGSDNTMHQAT